MTSGTLAATGQAGDRSIDDWIGKLRSCFQVQAPELMSIFETYAAEALFGRRYLAEDLAGLPPGARILEIGAGSFLLTCQLKREGFAITDLEPVSQGFSHFEKMRGLVLAYAANDSIVPDMIDSTGEALALQDSFDFAFSQNVMEHVQDVEKVIINVGRALRTGAVYRFTCPNYLFPYEPHFNMPTLFSRRLTEIVMAKRIKSKTVLLDPIGVWNSLNWINVLEVKAAVAKSDFLTVTFNTRMLADTFERVGTDPVFASRRSPGLRKMLNILVRLKFHTILRFAPAMIQPIMDCRIQRIK